MQKSKINPYLVLGVSPGATEKEIKKAYRDLSKKHHPDVNEGKSSEEFVKITEAYEMLSNPYDKRNIFNRRADPAGFDPWFSFIVNSAARAREKQQQRPLDIRLSIDIPVHIAFAGGEIEMEYVKNEYSKDKVKGEKSRIKLEIPKRMSNGFGIKMTGFGHKDGIKTGDLTVFVSYQSMNDKYMIDRMGNIKCRVEIPWYKTLSNSIEEICPFGIGEKVSIKLDSGAGNVNPYVLKGEGMKPYWGGANKNGDLIVEVVSSIPKNMNEEDRKSISEILKKYAALGL